MGIFNELGILDSDGTFTTNALRAILNRIKTIQVEGGARYYPCSKGLNIKPISEEFYLPRDIEDRQRYPDFWTLIIGPYEEIANALNIGGKIPTPPLFGGNFALPPPFIDSAAFNLSQGKPPTPPGTPLPQTPLELGALAGLIPESVPAILAALIKPPNLAPNGIVKLPKFSPSPNFPDKNEVESWKNPNFKRNLDVVFRDALQQTLSNPTELLNKLINAEPCFLIELAADSEMFGKPIPDVQLKEVLDRDKYIYVGQLLTIVIVASLMGNGGPTGLPGKLAGIFELIAQKQEAIEVIPNYYDIVNWRRPKKPAKSILKVPGLKNTDRFFRQKLVQIAFDLNLDVDWLAMIMSRESLFNPTASNPIAFGLIQFTSSPLGNLTFEDLKKKYTNATKQLDLVKAYFDQNLKNFAYPNVTPPPGSRSPSFTVSRLDAPIERMGNAYILTFVPGLLIDKDREIKKGDPIYTENAGFDRNKDGFITADEVSQFIEAQYVYHLRGLEYPPNESTDTLNQFYASLPKDIIFGPFDDIKPHARINVDDDNEVKVGWQEYVREYFFTYF